MFITICYLKKITLWVGGAMVKNLIPQCGGEFFYYPNYLLSRWFQKKKPSKKNPVKKTN